MPVEAIVIDTTITALGAREPAQGDIVVVGHDSGGSASDDIMTKITQPADADTQFGSASDIAKGIKAVLDQRVPAVYGIRAVRTDVVGESITRGSIQTLANFPVAGRPAVSIAGVTVTFTTGTPSDQGVLTADINSKTGDIYINGTGADPVDYSFVDWATTFDIIAAFIPEMDIIVYPGAPNEDTGRFLGDHEALVTRSNTENWVTPIMSAGDEAAAVIQTAFDFVDYQSKNVVAIAHKAAATVEVAAAVAGLLSVVEPWVKLMWKTLRNITTTFFTKTEVDTTLENGTTPVNALIQKVEFIVPSDGLTTAGASGGFEFIDITRTRYYLEAIITTALDELIRTAEVPFTDEGIAAVKSAIEHALQDAVSNGALRTPFVNDDGDYQRGYLVEIPLLVDVLSVDKTARILKDVFVTAHLAGHVQSIQLNLAIKL